MIQDPPRGRDQRAVLSLVAVIVTVGATIWLGNLSDEVPLLREAYGRWHGIGFVLLTALIVATLAGALLHSASARRAGRSVRLGWCNAALVLGYAAVIGLLAWYIGAEIPADFGSGRGGGAKGAYVAWLIAVVPSLAVVGVVGGLFPRVRLASAEPDPAEARTGEGGAPARRPAKFYQVVLVTAGICWALGALPFLLLALAYIAGTS
ncbi:hypothetical protein [Catellatospora chokoriensis]|uniref:hypothetical protein n=1 Tax=Catellatospora chokoriensis TaxID=310353 RepID=UPI0017833332|nr:hypothetical protein [Catellatospora chokoriensis]